jgi:hypothetical protein
MERAECRDECDFGECNYCATEAEEAYDGSKCNCTPCMNKELCGYGRNLPVEWRGKCLNCRMCGFGEILSRDCPENDVCTICSGTGRQMQFPSYGCEHWFCVGCVKELLGYEEHKVQPNPEQFGCPPCPNGCANPLVGKQCPCIRHADAKAEWKSEDPDAYNVWAGEEKVLTEQLENAHGYIFRKAACPICHRTVRVG